MYREYRDLTVAGAVTQCYRDMGARHRARAHSIQVKRRAANFFDVFFFLFFFFFLGTLFSRKLYLKNFNIENINFNSILICYIQFNFDMLYLNLSDRIFHLQIVYAWTLNVFLLITQLFFYWPLTYFLLLSHWIFALFQFSLLGWSVVILEIFYLVHTANTESIHFQPLNLVNSCDVAS